MRGLDSTVEKKGTLQSRGGRGVVATYNTQQQEGQSMLRNKVWCGDSNNASHTYLYTAFAHLLDQEHLFSFPR